MAESGPNTRFRVSPYSEATVMDDATAFFGRTTGC